MSSAAPRQLQNLSHKGAVAAAAGGRHPLARPRQDMAEAVSFNVNFNSQKPPEKTYSAETVFIQYRNKEVLFIFGQYDLLGNRLESAISLKLHGFWVRQFLRSVESLKNPTVEEIAYKVGIDRDPLGVIDQNPGHLAKLSANIIQVAISGHETGLDFYYMHPSAFAKAKGKKDSVELVGIVRVDVRTALFLSVYDKLKELEHDFPHVEENN